MTEAVPKTIETRLDVIINLLAKLVSKERPNPRRLLRIAEAAEYLHLSPWALRGIVQRGELSIIKLGENGHSPWLFDTRDLDDWINRTKATL
jgi:hypothetical protein